MSLVLAYPRFVSMCTVPASRGGMTRPEGETGLCLLEELVSTGWLEVWDLPFRRGQGGRKRMGVPGHDWGAKGPCGEGFCHEPHVRHF